MVRVCRLEVSIVARRNPSRDAGRVIQCRAGEHRMRRTARGSKSSQAKNPVMKYLIIAALVSIIFVLVYSRIRPYLKLIQTVANSLNAPPEQKTPSRNKLVRCDRCGTWIPADRAMKLNSGLATFCSAECMAQKQRKVAS